MGRQKSLESKVKFKKDDSGKTGRIVVYYSNTSYGTGITGVLKSCLSNKGYLTSRYNSNPKVVELANEKVRRKKRKIDDLIYDAHISGVANIPQFISEQLEQEKFDTIKKESFDAAKVSEVFEKWFEVKKDQLANRAEGSAERYDQLSRRIKEFEESPKGKKLSQNLKKVNVKWINSFISFLGEERIKIINVKRGSSEYTQRKRCQQNNTTINRNLKDFKIFLGWVERTFDVRFPQELFSHNILLREKSSEENVYTLSQALVEELLNYSPEPMERKAYDLFIFSLCTGMAYSDCITLHKGNVKENGFTIKKKRQKTGITFDTYMDDVALGIFYRYYQDFRDRFPSNQRVNIALKKIFKKIKGFHEKVDYYEYTVQNNKKNYDEIVQKKPLYEVLTFHCARKTRVTRTWEDVSMPYNKSFSTSGWAVYNTPHLQDHRVVFLS